MEYPPVLFLTDRRAFVKDMDRWFFNVADAYINVSGNRSLVWGEGFESYDHSLTLRNNIVKQFGHVKFFSALMVTHLKRKKINEEIKNISDKLIVMFRYHECWQGRCAYGVDMFGAKIMMLSYSKDAATMAFCENTNVDMIVHTPNTASASMYAPVVHPKRTHNAVLVGGINPSYPLRVRYKNIIERNLLLGATVFNHPGYHIRNVKEQGEKYSKALHENKIALFCSSVMKYQFSKYAEVAIAGSLIVASLPDDDSKFWAEHIVEVNENMSDKELVDIVNYWLEQETKRVAKAETAQKAVLSKYTTVHTAELIAESIALHQSGFRGTRLNYPFSNSELGDRKSVV